MTDDATPAAAPETQVTIDTPDAIAVQKAVVQGIQGASGGTVSVELDAATAEKLKDAITQGLSGAGAIAWGSDNGDDDA